MHFVRVKKGDKEPEGKPSASVENCSVRRGAVDSCKPNSVPEGLVGPSPFAYVTIEDQPCKALLDSGSRVTIVFESWYKRHIPHIPILPLTNLAIWGLSDSTYPYKGFVSVDVAFSTSEGVEKERVSLLALVCPDPKSPDSVPVILGTNTPKLRVLLAQCKDLEDGDIIRSLRISPYDLETREQSLPSCSLAQEDTVGFVKWLGPGPLAIPPRSTGYAVCQVKQVQPLGNNVLIVDTSEDSKRPAGVLVLSLVMTPSSLDVNNFMLPLRNESQKETAIPVGTLLAQVYTVDIATVPQTSKSPQTFVDPQLFNFGSSPIPETWKARLVKKLSERTSVFSLDEWDVGLAKNVEHQIRLSDSKPFRERSRRIVPADIDDVRRHLQELLAAGIIKESRSPYASPIIIVRKKNGRVCMCIDYRTLNFRTIPDQYTMPRIDDALDCLTGSK